MRRLTLAIALTLVLALFYLLIALPALNAKPNSGYTSNSQSQTIPIATWTTVICLDSPNTGMNLWATYLRTNWNNSTQITTRFTRMPQNDPTGYTDHTGTVGADYITSIWPFASAQRVCVDVWHDATDLFTVEYVQLKQPAFE